jgi:hypothetical protein
VEKSGFFDNARSPFILRKAIEVKDDVKIIGISFSVAVVASLILYLVTYLANTFAEGKELPRKLRSLGVVLVLLPFISALVFIYHVSRVMFGLVFSGICWLFRYEVDWELRSLVGSSLGLSFPALALIVRYYFDVPIIPITILGGFSFFLNSGIAILVSKKLG